MKLKAAKFEARQNRTKRWVAKLATLTPVFAAAVLLFYQQFIASSRNASYLVFDRRGDQSASGHSFYENKPDNNKRKPFLPHDEFFRKQTSRSIDNLTAYFYFDLPKSDPVLEPLWTCSSWHRDSKLIFLHVPRSAGSTIRSILLAYASHCKAAIAFVSHCIDLSSEHMNGDETWINGRGSWAVGQDCWLTFLANKSGDILMESHPQSIAPRVSSDLLHNNGVSILSGQIPLGCELHWTPDVNIVAGTPVKSRAMYVAFFRRPLDRFVSEFMLRLPGTGSVSIDEAVKLLNQTVVAARSEGIFRDKLSGYFITPEQKSMVENENIIWNPELRKNLTLINLSKSDIMFGIVERMPESLEMLQYLIDKDSEIPSLSRHFSSRVHLDKILSLPSSKYS